MTYPYFVTQNIVVGFFPQVQMNTNVNMVLNSTLKMNRIISALSHDKRVNPHCMEVVGINDLSQSSRVYYKWTKYLPHGNQGNKLSEFRITRL